MRDFKLLDNEKFDEEDEKTITSKEQIEVEKSVSKLFQNFSLAARVNPELPKLNRWEHVKFLKRCAGYLPSGYENLDASRTWLCYWILHSLTLLDVEIPKSLQDSMINFLAKCQCKDGGFGGGPGQYAHLAPTYAAVNSLCILGSKEAFDVIDRKALQEFLWSLRSSEGAFSMHKDGEVDIRGVYCALSIATVTNIYTKDLFENSAEWIVSCQTYEGGFSGYPGMETHGGYSFCGLASLILLNRGHLCDINAHLRWSVNRQMRYEGGFQGRTNKLVDGCYSFWQGGVFPLIHKLLVEENGKEDAPNEWLFDVDALQEYILVCCQNREVEGGLRDKPGKPRDVYHTCYGLSGLSLAQHFIDDKTKVIGSSENELGFVHPLYNICTDIVMEALEYFSTLPVPIIQLNT